MNTVTRVSLDSRSPTLSESNRCQAWPRTPVISAQAAAAGTLSSRTGAQNKTRTKAYGQPSPTVCSRSSCLTVAVFPLFSTVHTPTPSLNSLAQGKLSSLEPSPHICTFWYMGLRSHGNHCLCHTVMECLLLKGPWESARQSSRPAKER